MRIYTRVINTSITPAQLDNDFMLLTDSQDIDAVSEHFGVNLVDDYGIQALFVKVSDGDYSAVYGTIDHKYNIAPDEPLVNIHMVHKHK